MLKETICYSLQCDGCGRILLNKSFERKDKIGEVMYANYWRFIDGKHYCPRCYYEENDEIIPKEKNKIGENGVAQPYNLVDLGLPSGTLWMDRNIGASSPTDFGLYFAWGETTGYTDDEVGMKKQFSWTEYKHCKGTCNTLTKYCWNTGYGNYDYADSLVTLQPCDDVVYLLTNGKCKMPTREQIQELLDNTTYGWSAIGRVNGGVFTSKTNGNSIFVPANGICSFGSVYGVGEGGGLWSNSFDKSYSIKAWHLYFSNREFDITNGEAICGYTDKAFGIAVRGVSLKK